MKRSLCALGAFFVVLASSDALAANACVAAADKGQDLRSAGKLDEARATFMLCAKPSCNRVVRADCERWIKEIDATPAPAPVAEPVEEKQEKATAAPVAQPMRVSIAISDPANASTSSAVTQPSSAPTPLASIVLGGLGATSLVAFGYFQVRGWSLHSDLENGCAKTQSCSDAELEPARSAFLASGVALGVSVVSLGAAAILYFTRGSSAPSSSSRVGFTAHGAALSF